MVSEREIFRIYRVYKNSMILDKNIFLIER